MHKDSLLKLCRYYHGEKNNPYEGDKALLWDYERVWVEDSANDSDSISEYLSDYLTYGLRDFSKFDKIPVTLKAMLFNHYAKNAYSMKDAVSGFKEFYQKYYK